MKKLLSAVALATCAVFGANAVEVPLWAVGTWAGKMVSYNSADPDRKYEGFYEMTLGPSGGEKERFLVDDGTSVSRNVEWYDQTIISQDDCHVVMTCWYWNAEHDAKYTAKMILRQDGCSHYANSSCSESIEYGDQAEVKELTKLEMNTAPVEGWPEWVIGTWRGEVIIKVPDKGITDTGTGTVTVKSTSVSDTYAYGKLGTFARTDALKGWKIVNQSVCHIVATSWCWNDEEDDWFDAEFVFRNTVCVHYAQSSCLSVMHAGDSAGKDTIKAANLKRDGGDPAPSVPYVTGDEGATVTGDAETGFVVTPSEDATDVVVTIPSGVDAAKVTVKVSPEMKSVTPNGAAVRVVRGEADITDYLDIPAADGGVIDLNAATVKEGIAKEPLDAAKGAKVDFSSPDAPSLTTAPTREGLIYRLKEGATLEAMAADTAGDTKIGDGTSWTPTLSVTGGTSGFYTIQVTK